MRLHVLAEVNKSVSVFFLLFFERAHRNFRNENSALKITENERRNRTPEKKRTPTKKDTFVIVDFVKSNTLESYRNVAKCARIAAPPTPP